jgi:hypothetical protein
MLLAVTMIAAPAVAAAPADKADAVIAKAVRAMGGIDRIRALRSLVMRGFHYEGSYHQEFAASLKSGATMVRLRPNLRMIGCRPEIKACGQWGRIIEAYDGSRGWELNWPKQRLVRTVNKAERAMRCGAEFDPLFVDYKARGFTATSLGTQTLLGRRVIGVTITPPGCPAESFYFDPASYRLVMNRIAIPVHARGDAVDTVRINREFMTVAGVVIPSRSEEVALADNRVLGGGAWTSIEANTIADPRLFEAPTVHPSGITAVVLHMLDAAASAAPPSAVMAHYEAYRATPEGAAADIVYDLNWLGYELLKVDNYPVALAVFERVIAEHPDSADAYDSLGDAYLQQGDKVRARAAFDKVLALDPKREEAARKRAALATPG